MSNTTDYMDMKTGEQWMKLLDPGVVIQNDSGWPVAEVCFETTFITKEEYDTRILACTLIVTKQFLLRMHLL